MPNNANRLMKRILLSLGLLIATLTLSAQELNCKVQINSDRIEGSNKQIFQTLQASIEEFLNQSRWTNMTFSQQEKIDCALMIIVQQLTSDGEFTCEATIQANRPVYNTSYTTPILNFRDKNFNFTYQEFESLTYQQSQFQSNLTAMLAYYAYLIIGIDADSYQRLSGTPYFEACEQIVTACQTATMSGSEGKGWQSGHSNKNRYTLINNLLEETFKPFRIFFYEYHRLGLDEMAGNVANSRARIAAGLTTLKDMNKARPSNYVVAPFLDTKTDELVNIFTGGTAEEKRQVYDLLMDLDPTRSNTLERMTNN